MSKTVIEILEVGRLAVMEDRDEIAPSLDDDDVSACLKAADLLAEAEGQIVTRKVIRLAAYDLAIATARQAEVGVPRKVDPDATTAKL
jgi:hypothetical protein